MAVPTVTSLVAEPAGGLPTDPLVVVRRLSGLAGARCLSVLSGAWGGGGTIVTADPLLRHEHHDHHDSGDDWFDLLDDQPHLATAEGTPAGAVGGGWVVLLGHDLGRSTGRVRQPTPPAVGPRLPLAVAAFHDHLLRHDGSTWWAEALDTGDGAAVARARALADLARQDGGETAVQHGARSATTPDARAHMAAVERCVTAVRAGEVAQANVCSRFGLQLADGGAAAVTAWTALVGALSPRHGALVTGAWGALVGASPELYLSLEGGVLASAPVKGTRPSGQGRALRASRKDTSENIMIVDLVRNDLSRVCEPGSVRAVELLSVQEQAGVSHLVSRVAGRGVPGLTPGRLLRETFPPGSVTGTPKQRATEISHGLELAARGAHTGAVGLVGPALLELAVTIRSLEVAPDGTATLGVGGGVVADSTTAEEWHEVLTKAAPLLRALDLRAPEPGPETAGTKDLSDPAAGLIETVLVVQHRVVEAADHLARLHRSFWELTGRALGGEAATLLHSVAARLDGGAHRLRLHVTMDGTVTWEQSPCPVPSSLNDQPGLRLDVVDAPEYGMERHKYADRDWLRALVSAGETNDVALAGGGDTGLLETTRACLLAVLPAAGGRRPTLVTPACDGRILPGVTRQVLVDLATARGWVVVLAPLDAAVLDAAEGLLACNAIRGAQWVRRVGGIGWEAPGPALVELADALLARWRL